MLHAKMQKCLINNKNQEAASGHIYCTVMCLVWVKLTLTMSRRTRIYYLIEASGHCQHFLKIQFRP